MGFRLAPKTGEASFFTEIGVNDVAQQRPINVLIQANAKEFVGLRIAQGLNALFKREHRRTLRGNRNVFLSPA